jgi:hypothetical protein
MNSLQTQPRQVLGVITEQRAEQFLKDWANIRPDGAKQFLNLYRKELDLFRIAGRSHLVQDIAFFLRKAWRVPDARSFDWYLSKILSLTERGMFFELDDPPQPVTVFEAAIFYLRHNRRFALYCPNESCPGPYFFRGKKGQKFCSPECANPSRAESKRQSWIKNGAKWIENRKKKEKKK